MEFGGIMDLYLEEVIGIIDDIHNNEKERILQCARVVAEQVKKDKLVYIFGPGGHSNLGAMEMFVRAGGLMHVTAMLNQETMLGGGALKSMQVERLPGYGSIVVNDYGIGEGDLLIVVNAYGINAATIDAALTAKANGATVIGVCSHEHARSLPLDHVARHPSKKNLQDIVDYTIDCKVKIGDAVVQIEGFEQKVGALSTFANSYALECVMIEAINMLVIDGVEPPVWRSGNCEGGDKWNNKFMAKFKDKVRCL